MMNRLYRDCIIKYYEQSKLAKLVSIIPPHKVEENQARLPIILFVNGIFGHASRRNSKAHNSRS